MKTTFLGRSTLQLPTHVFAVRGAHGIGAYDFKTAQWMKASICRYMDRDSSSTIDLVCQSVYLWFDYIPIIIFVCPSYAHFRLASQFEPHLFACLFLSVCLPTGPSICLPVYLYYVLPAFVCSVYLSFLPI